MLRTFARVGICFCAAAGCADRSDDEPAGGSESESESGETTQSSDSGEDTTSTEEGESSATSSTDTGDGAQPEACAQMFRCLVAVAPEVAAPLLALYGEHGSCWDLAPDEQAICVLGCEGQLQLAYDHGLWDARACTGEFEPVPELGPEHNDTTCSDGFDNDEDTFIDCDDFDCSMDPAITVCS